MSDQIFSVGQTVTFRGTVQVYDPATDAFTDLTTPDTVVLLIEGPDGTARDDVPAPTHIPDTNVFHASYTLDAAGQWYAQFVATEGAAHGLNRRVASRLTAERPITASGS